MLLLCLAVTICVVAWGYLVLAAIDFGTAARGGQDNAWAFLGLACLGAAACLFFGLMLGARILRELGIITPEPTPRAPEPEPDQLDGSTPTLTVSPVVETTATRDQDGAVVPSPRRGEHPRGRRIASRAIHPDGPQQSGGRRIAR